jgi:hypothetical protein
MRQLKELNRCYPFPNTTVVNWQPEAGQLLGDPRFSASGFRHGEFSGQDE